MLVEKLLPEIRGRLVCIAPRTTPIEAAMTREVVTTAPGARLDDVWQVMRARGVKNIPVIDNTGAPLGGLNARDALRTLLQEVRNEVELLRDYAMSLGYR